MAGSEENQISSCAYCRRNHAWFQCTIVTNVQTRKDILRSIRVFFYWHQEKLYQKGIVILDHDAATVKGPITSVFVIDVGNHLNSKTLKRRRAKVQLVRQGRSHANISVLAPRH